MNRSLRRVALVTTIAFAALLINLTYIQVARSSQLANHPANRRLLIAEYALQRGPILAGTEVVAQSVATKDRLKYLRRYPQSSLYAGVSGYYSFTFGRTGVESAYNDYLVGKKPFDFGRDLVDELLGRDRKGNTVVLTIDPTLQRIAAQALGNQRGAVAAIDPDTGAVLALYSSPTYDPNPLASHDEKVRQSAWDALNTDKSHPLIARATQERYPPGSTFKPIVAAAALEAGLTPDTAFPNPPGLRLPLTNKTLRNFGGGSCPGAGSSITLRDGLRVSCNTTFAQTAMRIGADKLVAMAEKFGIDNRPDYPLAIVRSCVKASAGGGCEAPDLDVPQTALTGIGQLSVRVTPLQMAIVAATVQNGGRVPRPMIVREVQDETGKAMERFRPSLGRPIYSARTAEALKSMMVNVVQNGTGTNAQIPGVEVGGKTGTAQTGVENEPPHTWFISFAPHIAVAVIVENGGDLGNDATGGRVSAPIARALMESWIQRGGGTR